jgi:hypothetical protein
LLGIVICLAASGSAARDTGADEAFRLKESLVALRASDAVWRRNDAEFRAMRGTGRASDAESRQFAEFVAEQRRFMLEDCQEVRRLGGDPESLGFDCALPARRDVASIGVPGEAAGVPTEEEKDQALERRLSRLEGDLDDLFKSKQDQLRRDPVRQGGSQGASGGGRAGSRAGGDRAASGSGKTAAAAEAAGGAAKRRTGDARQGRERGGGPGVDKPEGARGGEARRAGGVPGGDDDDVVARQLREAAEKETDPVMKEKLWEEYEKYKEATS